MPSRLRSAITKGEDGVYERPGRRDGEVLGPQIEVGKGLIMGGLGTVSLVILGVLLG